jgi:CBS domain containing-hemolysin-like protein
MNSYLAAVILLLLAIAGVVARKTYYYVPARELKRRAEHHDALATKLYPAVAYGDSLRGLLWLWIGLTTAGAFVLLAHVAPIWMGLIAVVLLLWVVNSWLPSSRVTHAGVRLTSLVTPLIVWLLSHLHRPLSRGTGIVQKAYFLEMLEQQQHQPDSRLTDEEIEITKRALHFSDYKVSDILIPRKKVKTALASDTIGPVLIDELHKNGQGYMLVRESAKGSKSDFVGMLAFKRLSLRSTGQVKNVMDKEIYYLHADDSLSQALHAFFNTNCPLFVVVDSAEDYVGIISIDNILRQLLGHVPGEDFEAYHDVAAVVRRHAQAKPTEKLVEEPVTDDAVAEESPDTPVKAEEEVIE